MNEDLFLSFSTSLCICKRCLVNVSLFLMFTWDQHVNGFMYLTFGKVIEVHHEALREEEREPARRIYPNSVGRCWCPILLQSLLVGTHHLPLLVVVVVALALLLGRRGGRGAASPRPSGWVLLHPFGWCCVPLPSFVCCVLSFVCCWLCVLLWLLLVLFCSSLLPKPPDQSREQNKPRCVIDSVLARNLQFSFGLVLLSLLPCGQWCFPLFFWWCCFLFSPFFLLVWCCFPLPLSGGTASPPPFLWRGHPPPLVLLLSKH